jgi:thiol-disulfide isomerase/thioredoxin
MKKAFRIAQFSAHIAMVVIAVMLSIIVVKQYIFSPVAVETKPVAKQINSTTPTAKPEIQTPVGKTVPMQDVNWKENKKTLILYMSTSCRYCKESMPFYQKLVKETADKKVEFVAVLPQTTEEATEYFKTQNVEIKNVYNSSLSSIGVVATPILLLVNDQGVVSDYWRGKLPTEKEAEVLSKLAS